MLDQSVLDVLFTEARTHSYWQDKPINDVILKQIVDLTKMAPTSANCSPMRLVFVKSEEKKNS